MGLRAPSGTAFLAVCKVWAHYNARELEGLPLPVQRYFRAVLTDGQPDIASTKIRMTGSLNLSATAQRWKSFRSHQQVLTSKPSFLRDSYSRSPPVIPRIDSKLENTLYRFI
jgi:hypothetical protein